MSPDAQQPTTTAVAPTAKPSLNLPANTAPGLFSPTGTIFSSDDRFNAAMRVAGVLAKSTIVPARYHGKEADVLVALDFAGIVGVPALMVMQNLFVIEGKPTWAASFVIAAIRGCGRFSDVQFKHGVDGRVKSAVLGEIDNRTCFMQAVDLRTGDLVVGTTISYAMAIAEYWFDKKGSKWQSMGEQMLQYRAGSFFGRLHIADILLGMHDADEVNDAGPAPLPSTGLNEAGTEAVLVAQPNPRRVTPRAAPVAAPVMTVAPTPAPAVGEAQVGEYVESTPVPEESMYPEVVESDEEKAQREAAKTVNPFAAVAAREVASHPAPAPAPAAAPVQADFNTSQEHFDVLVKITENPLGKLLSAEERALVKEFAAGKPGLVNLPKRIDANIEITEAGLAYMRANAESFGYGLKAQPAETGTPEGPHANAPGGSNAEAGTPAPAPDAAPSMADMPLRATTTGGTVPAGPVVVSHMDAATWPEGFEFITEAGEVEDAENKDTDEAAHVRARRFAEQLRYFYKYTRPDLAPVATPAPVAETQAEANQRERDATQQQQYGGGDAANQKAAGSQGFF